MRIRAIRVNQWTCFTAPAGIEGLADGLNVLIAPNESGKSSLVAALKMALFTRHGVKGKAFTPYLNATTGGAPVVEVVFEVGAERFTLRKRYCRSEYATLTLDNGTRVEGEAAETMLADLLGHSYPGRGAGTAETMGLWGLLWVDQGDALDPIEAAEGARRTVMEALESTVGNVLGGEQGRRLPAMIREELAVLLTEATARPRGAYKTAIERVALLEAERAQLAAQHERFRRDLASYEEICAALEEKLAAIESPAGQEEIAATSRRLEELLAIESDIRAAASELDRLNERLATQRSTAQRRAALVSGLQRLREELGARQQEIADARDEESRLRTLFDEAQQAEALAAQANADAAEALRRANAVVNAARARVELERLHSRVARAETVSADIASLKVQLEANRATQVRLARLDAVNSERLLAESAMSAAATLLEFELEEGGAERLRLSRGAIPDAGRALELIESTEITIEGIGTLRIRPQIQNAATLQGALRDARAACAAALKDIGAADLAGARDLARSRAALEESLREAELEMRHIAPDAEGGLEGLRSARDSARATLDGMQRAGVVMADLPAPEAAQSAQMAAQRAAEEAAQMAGSAAEAVTRSRQALDHHRDAWRAPGEALARLAIKLQAEQESLDALPDDSAIEAAIADAAEQVRQQEARVAQLSQRRGADTVEQTRARLSRLDAARQTAQADIGDLRAKKAGLEANLARDGAGGLEERLASKERELEFAASEHARLEREARVLSTLNAALEAAEREARDRFMAPITEKIRPYLRVLFPEAELELEESLGVRDVHRSAQQPTAFAQLSVGTREQINLLVRIAIAELLAEQGRPAMVVIDDGLAHADDRRLERVFDILNMAAERVQILILSCHAGTFARAGGKLLTIQQFEESDAMRSA